MKAQITATAVTLLLCGSMHAQVSKESFEKAVDLLNCKTVELSIKNNAEVLQDFQTNYPCGETGYAQINHFLTSAGKLDATAALSNEVESLKKSFRDGMKKDEAILLLSESIFSNNIKYQKIFAFAEKRKGDSALYAYKAGLKTDLAATLVENIQQTSPAQPPTAAQQLTPEEEAPVHENANIKSDATGFLGPLANYLIIVAVAIGILAVILAMRKQSTYKALMPEILESKRLKRLIQDELAVDRNMRGSSYNTAELKEINTRIKNLEAAVEKLSSRISVISTAPGGIELPAHQQAEVKTEVFFLSTPNSDGSFNESSALAIPSDAATIYKFTKTGNNRAKFLIHEKETSVKLALQYPDKNIDPVCDAVNAFNPQATRITTVEQGEAELQASKWIVNRKTKIRYEN